MPAAANNFKLAQGLEKTLQLLSKTNNEAALDALVPALDSKYPAIQLGSLKALLERRSPTGLREVLKRLHTSGQNWRGIIEPKKGRLVATLRDAVLGIDPQMSANACQAILCFREYDLVPALLTALEDAAHPHAKLAAQTLLALAELLSEELSLAVHAPADRRVCEVIRSHVVESLEASVRRFGQHERTEVVQSLLLLARRDNSTLQQILQDPHHEAYVAVVDGLLHGQRPGVIALLLSFLDDSQSPSAVTGVMARRKDLAFLKALLRKVGQTTQVGRQSFQRLESLACLDLQPGELDRFDESSQQAFVQLAVAAGIRRSETFKYIQHFALRGKPAARVSAVKVLAQFEGAEADALVVQALADAEPKVQAAAAMQLRSRGATQNALAQLVTMIDSPHECVRRAARDSLPEFSFDRYVAAFDRLEKEARRTTGNLAKKINPEAISGLAKELRGRSRSQRLRALEIADAMDVLPNMQAVLIELLGDEDYLLRSEAARALGQCNTVAARHALHRALSDRSNSVQVAAEQSLEKLENDDRADLRTTARSTA